MNHVIGESKSESEVAQSCPTLCDPWTVAHQAPPSMGFSRQEYWSGLPFPSPGDLPDPGIEPRSPTLQAEIQSLRKPPIVTQNFRCKYYRQRFWGRKGDRRVDGKNFSLCCRPLSPKCDVALSFLSWAVSVLPCSWPLLQCCPGLGHSTAWSGGSEGEPKVSAQPGTAPSAQNVRSS